MAAAVVVTVVTGIDYGVRAVRLHRRPPPAGAGAMRERRRPGARDPAGPRGDLAARIVGCSRERRQTVAVAESLTGGLLGAAITTVPGASAVFRGGVIAYATDLKAALLGVPEPCWPGERLTPRWRARWQRGSGNGWEPRSGWRPPGWPGLIRRTASRPAPSISRSARAAPGDPDAGSVRRPGRDPAWHGGAALRLLWSVLREESLITALRHQRTRPMRSPIVSVKPGTVGDCRD